MNEVGDEMHIGLGATAPGIIMETPFIREAQEKQLQVLDGWSVQIVPAKEKRGFVESVNARTFNGQKKITS